VKVTAQDHRLTKRLMPYQKSMDCFPFSYTLPPSVKEQWIAAERTPRSRLYLKRSLSGNSKIT